MDGAPQPAAVAPERVTLGRLGLVVHPTRPLEGVREAIGAWAHTHGVAIGQVRVAGQTREVAEPVAAADCDLLVALGGDGTTLAALHAGAAAGRPVLGVACGSVGVLTSVRGDRAAWALDEVAAARSTTVAVPALHIAWAGGHRASAINDLVILRDGPGQAVVSITVDGVPYASVAGDGVVVATALGSSAYTMAAGGPLLGPGNDGMVLTPLAPHGGVAPPLVTGADSELSLAVEPGFGGVRYEVDGRREAIEGGREPIDGRREPTDGRREPIDGGREPLDGGRDLTIRRTPTYATLVTFADEEPRLTGLRRRGLVLDSPRVLVRRNRSLP
jgi:NAD+ kinase